MVVGQFLLAAMILVAGGLTPHYSHLSDTISRLGSAGQPVAALARAGLVLYGILVVIGATPLGDHAPGREGAVAGLIAVYGAAAVVAGIAPKDLPFARHTLASQIHVAATVVGGAAVIAAMVVVALRSPSPAGRRASVVAAVIATVTTIVFRFSWGSPLYGLVERTLVMAAMAWLIWLAVCLLVGDVASSRNAPTGQTFTSRRPPRALGKPRL